jgi:predicted molibdopterin-dependent oxidoreductase YjgC
MHHRASSVYDPYAVSLWRKWFVAALSKFILDGAIVRAAAGLDVLSALLTMGRQTLRHSPRAALPRGAFCMMGLCQECIVWVDGRRVSACRTVLRQGMNVRAGSRSEQPA